MISFTKIKDRMIEIADKLEENLKKTFDGNILKSLKLGLVALTLSVNAYGTMIGVNEFDTKNYQMNQTQEYLQTITGNSNLELNKKSIQEDKFKDQLNDMFVNLLVNNENNPNFTPLDKLKCLTGMNILNSDLSIEDTEDLLQKYKLLFNNLSVTITPDLIEKFHNNITPEQRNNILENSNKNLKELINLDNSENLTKSDRTVLNLYQNLAKGYLSDKENYLNNNDKVFLTMIIISGSEEFKDKILEIESKKQKTLVENDDVSSFERNN